MAAPVARPAPSTELHGGPRRLPRSWLVGAAVLPLLLLASWVGWLTLAYPVPAGARIGDLAPDISLADLDGRPVRLADLRGRPVVVNFWASWCGPCVEEFPLLQRALDRHRQDGLVVLGIVFRDRSEDARAFMAMMGADWTAAMDPGEAVAERYGIYGPPESFFINRDGVVAGRQIGQLSAADLDRQLATILNQE
jgi:cytochrome c biogenesis protein CcmG/thiol:disulfide interchange protein DsbE